ncbi:unnamed protein product, partial [Didymodactylos carnosus]
FIHEVNTVADPYYANIVESVQKNCQKLATAIVAQLTKYLNKENIEDEEKPFALVQFIMKHYGESKRYIFNQELIHAFPLIQPNWSINGQQYKLYIESQAVTQTSSQAEAIAALIGSYELFNMVYPSQIKHTLETLHGLFFSKRNVSLSLGTRRFLERFKFIC